MPTPPTTTKTGDAALVAQHRREIAGREPGFSMNAVDRVQTHGLLPEGAVAVVVPKKDLWFEADDVGDGETSVVASTLSNQPRAYRWSLI